MFYYYSNIAVLYHVSLLVLFEFQFNNMSTLVGHFVLYPIERAEELVEETEKSLMFKHSRG